MTTKTITIVHCDAADCDATAPAGSDGWFSSMADGCPQHAEIVAAHGHAFSYDTRGRGPREATTVSLTCNCGWVPPSRWTQGSTAVLIDEYLAHLREVTAPDPKEETS